MSTVIQTEARIKSVNVTDEAIVAHLADGRIISVPLEWSWRLSDASPEQRARWEIIGDGQGVHWPGVDEDISVEGMLRGAPAKRPRQRKTRILLDASSLIDLERGKPVSFGDLDRILQERHAQLVLGRTNVLEFSDSAARTGDFLALRNKLQQIERLPIAYLREVGITRSELMEAVAAFSAHREYAPINPYVGRWDETLVLQGPSPAQMLANQRLDDLVFMLWQGNALSAVGPGWRGRLNQQFKEDRQLPAAVRKAIANNFPEALKRHLAQFSIPYPRASVTALAEWIYANPIRCPGHRLAYDVRQELMNNLTETVSENDISDLAQVEAVPYIDAITMDRNTADLCRRVSKRLKKRNSDIRYEQCIFASLRDLLDAKLSKA
jgi:Protein of unknown function (DUF2442)